MISIAETIAAVHERITAAAQRANRSAGEVELVGVTKTQPAELIAQALAAGLHQFGENRVQEAESKIAALQAERRRIVWHLIGHLQSNKAKKAAALFDLVHSVDSARLATTLDQHRAAFMQANDALPLSILLQVNLSGEESKEGFGLVGWEERAAVFDAFAREVEPILALQHLRVRGLMTIAPWGTDPQAARPVFRSASKLRERLAQRFPAADWSQLSMGMTDDFEVAIEEEATIVRVGRAIFGSRI